ncbi:MAG: alpha-N-arabinofuranosidase [Lachnospiraceae bacterium]
MKDYILKVKPGNTGNKINKEIYGHFSEHLGRCIYGGIYVGKDSDIPNINGYRLDVVNALKEIGIPVLRWPGGCFADEYHWKDGIGPVENRVKMINTNWGGITEDNSFGTHEFMNLCEILECEPYIAGNLGSGTVQELSQWIEYMTFSGVSPMADLRRQNGREEPWKLKYLGIGNESWGCGGSMSPEYYSDLYKHYQTFCKNYGENKLYKVACGPNANDYNWTKVLMSRLNKWNTNAISLHYYTLPTGDWSHKGSSTEFDAEEYYKTIKATLYMEELLNKHTEIMNEYDPDNTIGLIVDEWGTWYDTEPGTNPGFLYQQNTMRDAIIAAINLNLFNNNCKRVVMANIAQTVNVLQSLLLTEGSKTIKTPTYYVFKMFKNHQEGMLIETETEDTRITEENITIPQLSVSASENEDVLTITISNASLTEGASLTIDTSRNVTGVSGRILSGNMNALNTFEEPENVFDTEFIDYKHVGGIITLTIPAISVLSLEITFKK